MILLAVKRLDLRKHLEASRGDESLPEQLGLWKVLELSSEEENFPGSCPKEQFRDEDEKRLLSPSLRKNTSSTGRGLGFLRMPRRSWFDLTESASGRRSNTKLPNLMVEGLTQGKDLATGEPEMILLAK
jgi:hypothetical protein